MLRSATDTRPVALEQRRRAHVGHAGKAWRGSRQVVAAESENADRDPRFWRGRELEMRAMARSNGRRRVQADYPIYRRGLQTPCRSGGVAKNKVGRGCVRQPIRAGSGAIAATCARALSCCESCLRPITRDGLFALARAFERLATPGTPPGVRWQRPKGQRPKQQHHEAGMGRRDRGCRPGQ